MISLPDIGEAVVNKSAGAVRLVERVTVITSAPDDKSKGWSSWSAEDFLTAHEKLSDHLPMRGEIWVAENGVEIEVVSVEVSPIPNQRIFPECNLVLFIWCDTDGQPGVEKRHNFTAKFRLKTD